MANVLVTGCAGFIGSQVVKELISKGHKVYGLDNYSIGRAEHLSAIVAEGDIRHKTVFNQFNSLDIEYVFHLAALPLIQESINDPLNAHENNVNGTLNVLEFCKKNKAKLIFSSSCSVLYPFNPYSLQKRMCEKYIKLYSTLYGLKHVILRYANVYGKGQRYNSEYSGVLSVFAEQYKNGDALTITGDGEQVRDFIDVRDVARANVKLMDARGIIDIGTGVGTSINEVAQMFEWKTRYIPRRKGEMNSFIANTRLSRLHGFTPKYLLSDWVKYDLD